MDRDVPGAEVVLQEVEERPTIHIGQADVEGDGVGLVSMREGERPCPILRDQALEAALARQFQQDGGEHRVVLDDEHDVVARLDGLTVVGRGRERHGGGGLPAHRRGGPIALVNLHRAAHPRGRGRLEGKEQSEGAAFAGRALQDDLTAQEPRDLAADGEAEAGPAVFPAGRAVRLLEGLEDNALLVLRDADSRVAHRQGHPLAARPER